MTSSPEQPGPSRQRTTTAPIDAPEMLVGRILDERYRLDEVLNTGGMGIIYEATQLNVDRRVAVKVLRPTLTRDPSLVERFQLEVQLVAQISHPNVVKLIDTGQDATGLTYLVMEFVEGKTLRQALRGSELTLWEILEVFAQVSNALIETHGQQIIHRDLKFDNIMVMRMRDGRIHVQLLDFGVAKLLSTDRSLTEGGQVAGTPGIVAPELVDGEDPTARSDLYSMGVLLFATLVGKAPFTADNDLELMRAHKQKPIPNLKDLVGDRVPEEVLDLTLELLAKDPELRPASARAVRRRLENMARRFQNCYPDATGYTPPEVDILEEREPSALPEISDIIPLDPEDEEGTEDGDEEQAEDGEEDRGWIGWLFPRPVVAPMTVVASLAFLLMLLVLVLIYLVYQQLWVPQ